MTLSEQTMTRAEVKAFFGIKETALCGWVKRGVLPAPTYVGRKTVWFKSSIDKALASMRQRSEKGMRK